MKRNVSLYDQVGEQGLKDGGGAGGFHGFRSIRYL